MNNLNGEQWIIICVLILPFFLVGLFFLWAWLYGMKNGWWENGKKEERRKDILKLTKQVLKAIFTGWFTEQTYKKKDE